MDPTWADTITLWSAPWVLALLLLMAGLAFAAMEVFLPSGGILGFLATCSIVAAVVVGFTDGRPWVGFSILATAVFGVPAVIVLALKWWPSTPLGRRMLLHAPEGEQVLPDSPRRRGLRELVNRVGVAKCKMLPGGVVTIDGRNVDAVSEGIAIDAGQRVRVIQVRGTRVVVRPVDDASSSDPDPLARPIDTVGSDPFDESPA
jgi:membrane-bound ClpP family serine protease